MKQFYYHPAQTTEELQQYYDLIRDIYIVEKNYDVELLDQYSQTANHFVHKKENQVIAGYRLNHATSINEIPSGHYVPQLFKQSTRFAELSRWAILNEWRKKLSIPNTFKDFALHAQQHSLEFYIAKVQISMIDFYQRLGLSKLGEAFYEPKTFAKSQPNNHEANFQMMLLPAEVLYNRYLTENCKP